MSGVKKDEEREYRISMEVIVDVYDAEEQSMGWHYHLVDKISFPFGAQCIKGALCCSYFQIYLLTSL